MRSFGLISSLAILSLLTIMSCVLDPTGDRPRTEAQDQEVRTATPDDPAASSSKTTTDETAIEFPVGDVIHPRAGCSVVQFCNASGSDGSVCQQQGCSLGTAENECKSEILSVCGSAVCPIIFKTLSGSRITLGCPPHICSGGAMECGGRCCPAGTIACGVNNVCCDGTCKTGCPC